MSTSDKLSRYQQVKKILDKTYLETNPPSYQGLGPFWRSLSHTDFLSFSLYGEKLIADKPEKSCCGTPPKTTRAEASGLIKGLKGLFPFDGEQFPPLPWDSTRLEHVDIEFIESWINDDCPEFDTKVDGQSRKKSDKALLTNKSGVVEKSNINQYKREIKEPKQRKNVDQLNDEEICKLREAFRWAKSLNAWPRDRRSLYSWGKLHGDVCAHGFEQFLTWHRMFLYDFEKNLQDFDPDVTLPYWDWTTSLYNENRTDNGSIIPKIFRCFITEEAIEKLQANYGLSKALADKLKTVIDKDFNSGVELFEAAKIEGEEYRQNAAVIINMLEELNPLWYNMRYPNMFFEREANGDYKRDANGKPIPVENGLRQFHHHFPTEADVNNLLSLSYWRDFAGGPSYNQAFGLVDMEPHNTIHIWVGGFNPNYDKNKADNDNPKDLIDTNQVGDMLANLTAGFDPIFWPHHVNIDRIFHLWQLTHPNQTPYDPDAALVGLGYNTRDALNVEALGYEYIDASECYVVDSEKHQGIISLQPEAINTLALETSRRVELRLHRITQPVESVYIHAFINQPDLTFDTSLDDNTRFAGHASLWGHGECVGGPGHCKVPEDNVDYYDRRGPNHNAKRNVILDITEALKAAVARGETQAQITLRLLNITLTDLAESLQIEAISINYVN
ncbi:MAG: tyrosinase family protein [Kangiellaceae bacterium]|nr:tyrosinase family protein [Kangiellaceae bacterium]